MKTKNIIRSLFVTLASFLLLSLSASAELKLQPHKENVVASKLEGSWIAERGSVKHLEFVRREDKAFYRKLKSGEEQLVINVRSDATVIAKVPRELSKAFTGRRIYMAGTMTAGKLNFTFVLMQLSGNPHIVVFKLKDGGATEVAGTFNVMLAGGEEAKDDLLFIGDDFNGKPFLPLTRITPKK